MACNNIYIIIIFQSLSAACASAYLCVAQTRVYTVINATERVNISNNIMLRGPELNEITKREYGTPALIIFLYYCIYPIIMLSEYTVQPWPYLWYMRWALADVRHTGIYLPWYESNQRVSLHVLSWEFNLNIEICLRCSIEISWALSAFQSRHYCPPTSTLYSSVFVHTLIDLFSFPYFSLY